MNLILDPVLILAQLAADICTLCITAALWKKEKALHMLQAA